MSSDEQRFNQKAMRIIRKEFAESTTSGHVRPARRIMGNLMSRMAQSGLMVDHSKKIL
jgi:hypothetical protein